MQKDLPPLIPYGVTNKRSKVKETVRHGLVMPRAAILDPAVTVHTPEWLWLSTGIRAVDLTPAAR